MFIQLECKLQISHKKDIWSSLKRFIKERKRFLSAVSIAPFLTWSDVSLTQNTSSLLHVTNTFPAEGPFQSDALLVPEHCLFDHIHNQTKCWNFDQWNGTAGRACSDRSMRLRSFAMLLPCGIDVFSGVEFVCCPAKKARKGQLGKRARLLGSKLMFYLAAQRRNICFLFPAVRSNYSLSFFLDHLFSCCASCNFLTFF